MNSPFHWHIQKCKGACGQVESPEDYNQRATQAIGSISFQNESFFLVSKGRHEDEMVIVCIENGRYKGFGFLGQPSMDDMRSCIKKYPHNRDIQNILCGVKGKVRKVMYDSKNHTSLNFSFVFLYFYFSTDRDEIIIPSFYFYFLATIPF